MTGDHRAIEGGPSGRQRARDPLGKQALFSAAPGAEEPDRRAVDSGRSADEPDGAPPDSALVDGIVVDGGNEHSGPIVIECATCGEVTRVGPVKFVVLQLPLSFWVPRGRFGHRMTCPACGRRSWTSVGLRLGAFRLGPVGLGWPVFGNPRPR